VRTALLNDKDPRSLADALAHHAEENGIDLIVLNSHARGGLARWWLGNVAEDLVRRTSLPVLVTPSLEEDTPLDFAPSLRHILIPLSGEPLAEQMIPTARAFGGLTGTEYTLLRIVEPAPVPVVDPSVAPAAAYDPGLAERQLETAEDYLKGVSARLRREDATIRLRTRVAIDPEPAEAICGFLSRRGKAASADANAPPPVDLIALATHGREGLTRLLLGSVADRVLQHSPVPLLLQRPAKVPATRETSLV
jgi:nucleotide-binding universal stress UspA family protein